MVLYVLEKMGVFYKIERERERERERKVKW
jgi:hypothetical protein